MVFDRITLIEAYKTLKIVNENDGKVTDILFNKTAFYGTKTQPRFRDIHHLRNFIETEYGADNRLYPRRSASDFAEAMPWITDRFSSYNQYSNMTLTELFGSSFIEKMNNDYEICKLDIQRIGKFITLNYHDFNDELA